MIQQLIKGLYKDMDSGGEPHGVSSETQANNGSALTTYKLKSPREGVDTGTQEETMLRKAVRRGTMNLVEGQSYPRQSYPTVIHNMPQSAQGYPTGRKYLTSLSSPL